MPGKEWSEQGLAAAQQLPMTGLFAVGGLPEKHRASSCRRRSGVEYLPAGCVKHRLARVELFDKIFKVVLGHGVRNRL